MDRLSEIELENKSIREVAFIPMPPETQDERMARVLRELAGLVLYFEKGTRETLEGAFENYGFFGGNLSDDAKELCVAARDKTKE